VALTEKPERRSPVMYHKWRDLLFLHWEFEPLEVQATLPRGLYVDTFESKAYVGIVPFYMFGVRPRFSPPYPFISNFLELNLRTYVYDDNGNPGIWFYSLDANRRVAVGAARLTFGLPYFLAEMKAGKDKNTGRSASIREEPGLSRKRLLYFVTGEGEAWGQHFRGRSTFFLPSATCCSRNTWGFFGRVEFTIRIIP
jgi:uncharacterized protein YqjF (DUF2071 family)